MKTRFFLIALAFASLAASAQAADYDTNRGFVHPGGLHTQADFDRVKQQLADGNTLVKAAYQKLVAAAYSQSSVQTYPTETIVRGGGVGENYINACRGAAMAYQNALRWKIAGSKANAAAAVRILMAWANTTKDVGGDSNYALAIGLYGYQFAQAAELMRDYEGWDREEFEQFKKWMLTVWYPKANSFLRGRNGTWENVGKWWQAPGHYWSNWGLCNIMCVAMIGILCDDVFIYNQAMSYFKYDQCGTFKDPRTETPIKNDGLVEFLGNLVVTTYASDLETGAYGLLGQMNESGRDTGHSAMALGLAIDMAKIGWSQGDDLFAYMDHRLAAGIEYVAAQTQSIEGLPWVNYHYGSSGYYYSDSRAWLMTEPALGAQMRPYWGSVIGIYEGVKGVKMPFSEVSYKNMGIDEGGQGSTSGGYDHLGYSVLMNTRDEQLCPAEKVPTELQPQMEYSSSFTSNLVPSLTQEKTRKLVNGRVINHSELGGLVNTYAVNNKTTVPTGKTLKLMPQLPEGEEDTGKWLWNTGETTREITVATDRSFIYRVTYTNANGIESQQCFSIAVTGDCVPDILTPSITVGSVTTEATTVDVLYGKSVTLKATPNVGYGTFKWSTGGTTETLTRSVTADAQYTVDFTNQGGAVSSLTFDVHMIPAEPYVKVDGGEAVASQEIVAEAGQPITFGLTLPSAVKAADVVWDDGSTGSELTVDSPQTSGTYTATFTLRGTEYTITFELFINDAEAELLTPGRYLLYNVLVDRYLTANGKGNLVTFEPIWESGEIADAPAEMRWWLERSAKNRYGFVSLSDADSLRLASNGKLLSSAYYPFYAQRPLDSERLAFYTGTDSSRRYWGVDADGNVLTAVSSTLKAFPFLLIPVSDVDGISEVKGKIEDDAIYDLSGRRVNSRSALSNENKGMNLRRGIYLIGGKKVVVK